MMVNNNNVYKNKYLKYKQKYLTLKNLYGGDDYKQDLVKKCKKEGSNNVIVNCDGNLSATDNVIVKDDKNKKLYINLHLDSSIFENVKKQMNNLVTEYLNKYTDYHIYILADGNCRLFINKIENNYNIKLYKKETFGTPSANFKENETDIIVNRPIYGSDLVNEEKEKNNKNFSTAKVRLFTSQFSKFLVTNNDLIDWILYCPPVLTPASTPLSPPTSTSAPTITCVDGLFSNINKTTKELEHKTKTNEILPSDWVSDHALRTMTINNPTTIKCASLNLAGQTDTTKSWAEFIDSATWKKYFADYTDDINKFVTLFVDYEKQQNYIFKEFESLDGQDKIKKQLLVNKQNDFYDSLFMFIIDEKVIKLDFYNSVFLIDENVRKLDEINFSLNKTKYTDCFYNDYEHVTKKDCDDLSEKQTKYTTNINNMKKIIKCINDAFYYFL